jgi:hypothetical protein
MPSDETRASVTMRASAFPEELNRSSHSSFGQHLPPRRARMNVSGGWMSAGLLLIAEASKWTPRKAIS